MTEIDRGFGCFELGCKGVPRARQYQSRSEALIECCPVCVGSPLRAQPGLYIARFEIIVDAWRVCFDEVVKMKRDGAAESEQARAVERCEATVSKIAEKPVWREAARVAGWRNSLAVGARVDLTIGVEHFQQQPRA